MMKFAKITFVGMSVLILVLAATSLTAQAQTPEIITAEVDRTRLTTDDTLTLTVSIDDSAGINAQPILPSLDGFQVIGTSSGTQMSIINGSMTIKKTYQYRLLPMMVGSLVIDAITVSANGQTYATQPIRVEVTQGNGQPTTSPTNPFGFSFPTIPGFANITIPNFPSFPSAAARSSQPVIPLDPSEAPAELERYNYYLESKVDDESPFQGQQIVHTLRLYQPGNSMFQPQYQPPSFTGFWSQVEPEQTNYALDFDGRSFRVLELKTILIPTVVGEIDVDPVTVEIDGGFFGSGQTLQSGSLKVDVQPLPEGAPATFRGAVGQFELSVDVDKRELTVNDTVKLSVDVQGSGNFETMGEIIWPELPEWRAFDSESSTATELVDGQMTGVISYERVLLPARAGFTELPSIEFSYFDPISEEYVTSSTQPIPINVLPDGTSGTAAPPLQAVNPGPASALPLAPELQPLKPAPARWQLGDQILAREPAFWLLWLAPLLVLGAHAGWQLSRRNRIENAPIRQSQQAKSEAIKRLKQIGKKKQSEDQEAGRILVAYLEKKLQRSLTGQTHSAVVQLLAGRGVSESLLLRVETVLLHSDVGRYAPSELDWPSGDIVRETEDLVQALDKEL